jgi:hypothetical protein
MGEGTGVEMKVGRDGAWGIREACLRGSGHIFNKYCVYCYTEAESHYKVHCSMLNHGTNPLCYYHNFYAI